MSEQSTAASRERLINAIADFLLGYRIAEDIGAGSTPNTRAWNNDIDTAVSQLFDPMETAAKLDPAIIEFASRQSVPEPTARSLEAGTVEEAREWLAENTKPCTCGKLHGTGFPGILLGKKSGDNGWYTVMKDGRLLSHAELLAAFANRTAPAEEK